MTKGGGKGRIPNPLVAASCAAVLAVYAAGYWRTREEARRMDVRPHAGRPVRTTTAPAPTTNEPAVSEPPAPSPEPPVATHPSPASPAQGSPSAPAPGAAVSSAAQQPPAQTQLTTQVAVPQPPPLATPEPTATAPAASDLPLVVTGTPASESPPESQAALSSPWRDGTYTGWGTSRHGDIKAQVVIRNGRIVEAGIASCETRYPCDVIDTIIPQPVARQSPDVDTVSRATESADAYYFGLVEALKEAQAQPDAGAGASGITGGPGAG